MPTTGPINVTDNRINGGIPFEISATGLSIAQSVSGTATYTITQQDINNGSVTNLANATGSVFDSIFLWLPVTSNNTNVTVLAIQNPTLKIENSVDPKVYFAVGDLLDYDYTVINTGNVDITGPIKIKDNRFGLKQIGINKLAPGESVRRSASHLVPPQDIYNGFVVNSAFAKGSFNNQTVTSNTDKARAKFFGPTMNLYSS